MKTVKEQLTAVRAKISDPAHHTTRTFARDANGIEVEPTDPSACQWCIMGAFAALGGDESGRAWDVLRLHARELFDTGSPILVNDRGRTAILKLLDAAIEATDE